MQETDFYDQILGLGLADRSFVADVKLDMAASCARVMQVLRRLPDE